MPDPAHLDRRITIWMDHSTRSDAAPELDASYRLLREEAACVIRERSGFIEVSGADSAEFLQGQLTNDIEALASGNSLYAALLDRKAHITADCRVIATAPDDFLLVAEATAAQALLEHLQTYKIGRKVEISDLSDRKSLISVIGPATRSLLDLACTGREGTNAPALVDGVECLAVGTSSGVDLICEATRQDELISALASRGVSEVPESASEILRIESGIPRFERELTSSFMPAEVGIVERAVSFDKGCYLGQEPVARLHYKGRPNRLLRGLKLSRPGREGETIQAEDRELGELSSACVSPALGPIGLAVIRREAEPGTKVMLGDDGAEAEVVELPLRTSADLH